MKGEQLNKPKLISKYATQKCIPVFVKNSHLDLVHTKDTPNATITFIKYKNTTFCGVFIVDKFCFCDILI